MDIHGESGLSEINLATNNELDKAIDAYHDRHYPTVVMLACFCVIGVPGNLIVVLIYIKGKKMTMSHFLIFIVAALDSFICTLVVPFNIVTHLHWLEIQNVYFCKCYWAINMSTISSGIYMIAGISVVRYFQVCKTAKLHFVEPIVKPFCLCCFLVGFIIGIFVYKSSGNQTWHELDSHTPGYLCSTSDEYLNTVFYDVTHMSHTITYIICLFTIITFNSLILRQVFKQKQIMAGYRRSKTWAEGTHKILINKLMLVDSNPAREAETTSCKFDENESSNGGTPKQEATSEKPNSENDDEVKTPEQNANEKVTARRTSDEGKSKTRSKENNEDYTLHGVVSNTASIRDQINDVKKSKQKKRRETVHFQKKEENQRDMDLDLRSCCRRFVAMLLCENWNRTTLKLFLVSFVYVVTYTPYFAISLYLNFGESMARSVYHDQFKYIYIPGLSLGFFSSAVNPIIYTFVDPKFRSQLYTLFKRKNKVCIL